MKCMPSVSFSSGIYCSKRLSESRVRKNQDFDSEIKTRIRKVGKPYTEFRMIY